MQKLREEENILKSINNALINEMSLISCIWIDNNQIHKALILSESDFTDDRTKRIFSASKKIILEDKKKADMMAARNYFRSSKEITPQFLLAIENYSPSALLIDENIREIKNHRSRVALDKFRRSLESEIWCKQGDFISWVQNKELDFNKIINDSRGHLIDESNDPKVYAVKELERYKKYKDYPSFNRGIKTLFSKFDTLTGGLWLINLIVGTTGVGKSTLGVNMAANIALKQGIPALYINLEMLREDLIRRIASFISSVPSDDILCGTYANDNQWKSVENAMDTIREIGTFYITDNKPQKISDMVSQIYHYKTRHEIEVVFIDHLGEISPDDAALKEKNSSTTYGRYVQSIKNACSTLKLKCVLLHQFNRSGDKSHDRDNIGLSWQIVQKADLMATLWEENEDYRLEIQKHRHKGYKGKRGIINLDFNGAIHQFSEREIPF